jgi:hypothetical protein
MEIRKFLRLRLNFQGIDFLVVALLVVGGIAGYSKFPAFINIADVTGDANAKLLWIGFFVLFVFATTFKIIFRAYFSLAQAAWATAGISTALLATTAILSGIIAGNEVLCRPLSFFVTCTSGASFLVLAVQSWFKPQIDLRALEETRAEFRQLILAARRASPLPVNAEILDRLRECASSFPDKAALAKSSGALTTAETRSLADAVAIVKNISTNILSLPDVNVSDALNTIDINALMKGLR